MDYTVRSTRWFDLAGKCKQEFDSTEKRIRLNDGNESDEEHNEDFDCWDLIFVGNTRNFDCCNSTKHYSLC